ncbi:MFS transporter [Falsihalocynthiibacter sp. SS001]|uniref:MFS transporter n=1 Tax=Falsihalocynthiibacter sp. SS001 TaxID=3349698 RepID=UPI0036D369AA
MPFTTFLVTNARWLLAGFSIAFVSSFGQTYFISIFAGAIRSEFDLSHGAWGGIYLIGTSASAITMIWAGGLVDRWRIRSLCTIILLMLAVACLSMAAVPSATALIFVIFALRFTGQGMLAHATTVSMARWFVATRGRALAIASLGFKTGEAILPLIFVALMAWFAWRDLWILAAGLALLVIPLLAVLLKHERTPQSISTENQSVGMQGRHWTRNQTLRHWLFWYMLLALMGPPCFMTALFFQQVHISEVKGFTHISFVALFPIFTIVSSGAMMLAGWAIDRFSTPRILPTYLIPMSLGFFLAAQSNSLLGMAVALGFLGLSQGAASVVVPAFWAEFYGTRNLGSIKAMAAAVMVASSAVGPGLSGVLIDMGIDFSQQMYGIAIYFLCAVMLIWLGMQRVRLSSPLTA